jgi:hypothetical protein
VRPAIESAGIPAAGACRATSGPADRGSPWAWTIPSSGLRLGDEDRLLPVERGVRAARAGRSSATRRGVRIPRAAHFEQACELVTGDHIASPVGPDVERHLESLQQFADAGVDELFVQQIGPEQDAFFTTWASQVLPRFG